MYNAVKISVFMFYKDVYNTMFVFTAYKFQCPFALGLSQSVCDVSLYVTVYNYSNCM